MLNIPNNSEYEKKVLSSILNDDQYRDELFEILSENDFYNSSLKGLFKALYRIYSTQGIIDTSKLVYEHREHETAVIDVSEIEYVQNVVGYAHDLLDLRKKREALHVFSEGLKLTQDNSKKSEEIISCVDSGIYKIGENVENNTNSSVSELLPEVFDDIEKVQKYGVSHGLMTGYSGIDKITTGLYTGELTILAARPGMGKTSLALNMALNISKMGKVVQVFSLEMSRKSLVQRMLSTHAMVEIMKMRTGQIPKRELSNLGVSAGVLQNMQLEIDDKPAITPTYMRTRIRRTRSKYKSIDLVIVDYLQLMRGESGKESRQQEISEISRMLKQLSKEYNTHVLSLSQLNRALENRPNKRPTLSDLRESGSIEQDADNVMFIYNASKYDSSANPNMSELIIGKQRNGPVGTVELHWDGRYTKFSTLEKNEHGEF